MNDAKERVLQISRTEELNIEENVVEEIVELCKGDMRKVVNMLQSLKLSSLQQGDKGSIDKGKFFEIVGTIPRDVVKEMYQLLKERNYTEGRTGRLKRDKEDLSRV